MGKKNKMIPTSFTCQGENITESFSIAKLFNEYFCDVANNLAQNIENTTLSFKNYLPQPVIYSFYLQPASCEEINDVIYKLRLTSSGVDDVHMKVIKACKEEMSPFLKYIINQEFTQGIFPRNLQIAKVIPVYKKGDSS